MLLPLQPAFAAEEGGALPDQNPPTPVEPSTEPSPTAAPPVLLEPVAEDEPATPLAEDEPVVADTVDSTEPTVSSGDTDIESPLTTEPVVTTDTQAVTAVEPENGGASSTASTASSTSTDEGGGAESNMSDDNAPEATTTASLPETDAQAPAEATEGTTTAPVLDTEGVSTTTEDTRDVSLDDATVEVAPADDLPAAPISDETARKGGETVSVNTVTNDANRFTFDKDACVRVGDGSFYCSSEPSVPAVTGTDRVFAAVDDDGDREIYVEKSGTVRAITDNSMDDDAPYFDEASNSIVWHRLVDGRYQIVEYDVATNEEHTLTHDRYNNMEPSRYGALTVWQAWVGNDWEIMLDDSGTTTMITDNTYHDISPRVSGTYVVWQAFEDGAWRVKVYDALTKKTETIGDAGGASLENPRFVLVYDSKQENGDVETRGYDLHTKKNVPLESTPAPVPDRLPNPDETGEHRALVQPPVQLKTKDGSGADVPIVGGSDPDDDIASSTDRTSDELAGPTLDLTEGTTTAATSPEAEDLVVTPLPDHATSTATDHIDDVIVVPFSAGVLDTDPQTGVASST
ncbi:MAG TPA: hypothetical protein VFS75_02390 [Candidatus Paceibacterota bacterium]|nr:hypothetical protein [Candidatus Paceibacterota bacterium]